MTFNHRLGDVREVLAAEPDNSFDALLCDPPYGLSFMGKEWDTAVPGVEVWREVYRVLKPGAFGLVFGGTRTFDVLGVSLRRAGFERRDCLCWLYGSGFPKSTAIGKMIDKAAGAEREVVGRRIRFGDRRDYETRGESVFAGQETGQATAPATPEAATWEGYGTALKPAWEPVLVIRKPPEGTNAENCLKWGTGALNIDGGRIAAEPWSRDRQNDLSDKGDGWGFKNEIQESHPAGRWPANVVLSHTPECRLRGVKRVKGAGWTEEDTTASTSFFRREGVGSKHYVDADGLETVEDWDCSPDCPVRLLDEQSGERPSGGAGEPETQTANCYWKFPRRVGGQQQPSTGGASRFFYCAKASPAERNAGCEGLEDVSCGTGALRDGCRGKIARNHHPTVKPVDLCRWLAALLLPPAREPSAHPRRLLVPFAGSGSEMIGAHLAGWDRIVGIELNPEYVEIQRRRCAWWAEHGAAGPDPAVVLAEGKARDEERAAGQLEMLEVDE